MIEVGADVTVVLTVVSRSPMVGPGVVTEWNDEGFTVVIIAPETYWNGFVRWVRHDQEGVMWARGHSGPAVEALHAAEALT